MFVILLGSVIASVWYAFAYDRELSHKAGWSVLQGFEFSERGNRFVSSRLRRTKDGRYAAVSVLGIGEPEGGPTDPPQIAPSNAWVLLNEHAADETVLVTPQFHSYRISCALVGRLPSAVPDVDSYVLKYLSARCR